MAWDTWRWLRQDPSIAETTWTDVTPDDELALPLGNRVFRIPGRTKGQRVNVVLVGPDGRGAWSVPRDALVWNGHPEYIHIVSARLYPAALLEIFGDTREILVQLTVDRIQRVFACPWVGPVLARPIGGAPLSTASETLEDLESAWPGLDLAGEHADAVVTTGDPVTLQWSGALPWADMDVGVDGVVSPLGLDEDGRGHASWTLSRSGLGDRLPVFGPHTVSLSYNGRTIATWSSVLICLPHVETLRMTGNPASQDDGWWRRVEETDQFEASPGQIPDHPSGAKRMSSLRFSGGNLRVRDGVMVIMLEFSKLLEGSLGVHVFRELTVHVPQHETRPGTSTTHLSAKLEGPFAQSVNMRVEERGQKLVVNDQSSVVHGMPIPRDAVHGEGWHALMVALVTRHDDDGQHVLMDLWICVDGLPALQCRGISLPVLVPYLYATLENWGSRMLGVRRFRILDLPD